MNDPIPLHIASLFLLVLTVLWTRLVWSELGFTRESVVVNPLRFLIGSFIGLIVVLLVTFLIGAQFIGLAVIIGLAGVLSLAHPVPAICVLTSFLVIRPWELIPEAGALGLLPRLFAMLALLSWIMFMVRRQSLRLVWNHSCSVLSIFVLWLLLTCVVTGSIDQANKLLAGYIPIFVLFILIINVPKGISAIDGLVQSIIISVSAVMAIALYITSQAAGRVEGERLFSLGLVGNANDLAACIIFALPLLFFSVRRKGFQSIFRPLTLFMTCFLLLALWQSQSRGALLAVAAMLVGYMLLDMRSVKGFIFLAFGAALVPAYLIMGISRDEGDLAISQESRWGYLIAGVKMFRYNPIFGVGAYNYPRYYDQYAEVFYEEGDKTAHSSWILPLAEAGLPGLILFVTFYGIALWRSFRIRRERPEFFYALVGYGVTITFLSHTYMLFPYLLAGVSICAARIIEREKMEKTPDSNEVLYV